MGINQNTLAKAVALVEGKKINVNIAQIKEVQRALLILISQYPDEEILKLINRYRLNVK